MEEVWLVLEIAEGVIELEVETKVVDVVLGGRIIVTGHGELFVLDFVFLE